MRALHGWTPSIDADCKAKTDGCRVRAYDGSHGAVKGGYEVRVRQQPAFCPIDSPRPSGHERRVYELRIVEYYDSGRNPPRESS